MPQNWDSFTNDDEKAVTQQVSMANCAVADMELVTKALDTLEDGLTTVAPFWMGLRRRQARHLWW